MTIELNQHPKHSQLVTLVWSINTTRDQLNNESLTFGVGTNFAPHSNNVSFSEQQINLYEQQIEKVENHQLLNLIN